ncbi:hypothetical protein ACFOZ0_21705 [Streptomyces yaanensis]|uniref:Uncharacterized protein n=1 Tax=Streptomyces yaanensis TaxID=1142239 RepID=A0ABV7SJH9_9ACTN|nr:hypothetical protein [Streptomyces sp. CGMCC 4.7035]WNB97551.1 hypothetical protein Q2K21_05385 [Streptomyces sp. CGMCC 4.7035]
MRRRRPAVLAAPLSDAPGRPHIQVPHAPENIIGGYPWEGV